MVHHRAQLVLLVVRVQCSEKSILTKYKELLNLNVIASANGSTIIITRSFPQRALDHMPQ